MKKTFYTITTIALTVLTFSAQAQIISTAAGTGTAGFSGDGSAATAAEISFPGSSAVDAAGNLYIADKNNNRIRRVDPSGIITTVVGTGTGGFSGDGSAATAAQISAPLSVCFDAAGNMYVADHGNSRIRKVNTSGIISTVVGTTWGIGGDGGAATAAQINAPTDVTVDAAGNMYICDYGNHRIRKVNTSGVISTVAGSSSGYSGDGGPATAAQFNSPNGVCVDAAGNIYIADLANVRIRKVNTAGTITTIAGTGMPGYTGDGGAATAATLGNPAFVTMDVAGNIFFSDLGNNVVRKISASGIITTVAGNGTPGYTGDGGAATAAKMTNPTGVNFDAVGNLYITAQQDHAVRKVTAVPITLSGATTICIGATTTLTGSASGAVWSSGSTSIATVGATTGVVTGLSAGTVNISYTTGLGFGYTTVSVNSCPTSVNNTTQVTEPKIFPNPSSGSFTIDLPGHTDHVAITILDLLGKEVSTKTADNTRQLYFNLNNIPTGTYIVIVNEGSNTYRTKIMITE